MYKTVRQGENSLQYTILPQQDDKDNNQVRGGGRRLRPTNRKKSIFAYVGLFFVCAVIITFAILILMTSDLMSPPQSWFYRNQKAREFRNPIGVKLSVDHDNQVGTSGPIAAVSARTSTTKTSAPRPTTGRPLLWSDMLSVTDFQRQYKNDDSDDTVAAVAVTTEETPKVVPDKVYNRPMLKTFKVRPNYVVPVIATTQATTTTTTRSWLQARWSSYVDPSYLQWAVRIQSTTDNEHEYSLMAIIVELSLPEIQFR